MVHGMTMRKALPAFSDDITDTSLLLFLFAFNRSASSFSSTRFSSSSIPRNKR